MISKPACPPNYREDYASPFSLLSQYDIILFDTCSLIHEGCERFLLNCCRNVRAVLCVPEIVLDELERLGHSSKSCRFRAAIVLEEITALIRVGFLHVLPAANERDRHGHADGYFLRLAAQNMFSCRARILVLTDDTGLAEDLTTLKRISSGSSFDVMHLSNGFPVAYDNDSGMMPKTHKHISRKGLRYA